MELAVLRLGPIKLVGFSARVGFALLYTLVLIGVMAGLRWLARRIVSRALVGQHRETLRFWVRQVINIVVTVIFIAVFLSIWFNNPSHLATGLGLVSAGLAFALQQVVTSIAGYLVILRGDMFNVGDRVVMGGVRGDVISIGFIKTTIMEMGAPTTADDDDQSSDTLSGSWVRGRQYTGRIVTVTNSTVFEKPVYNYTRDFPYLWEEISVPIRYTADRRAAVAIMLDSARRHTVDIDRIGSEELARMRRRYFMPPADLDPAVFRRLTDNWLELTVRFAVPSRGIRKIKSDMSEEILAAFEAHGIEVASATYDIVGLPPVRLRNDGAAAGEPPAEATSEPSSEPGLDGPNR